VVENVGGAGGTLGAAKVAKATPDGYTLLLHHIGMSTAPALYRKLPYNTLDDFEYLGMVNDVPMTLIGRTTLPANNYAELVKWLERQQGQDQPGQRRPGRRLAPVRPAVPAALKIDMTTVPYKGTAPAMTDLLGGQVDLMCDQTTNTTGRSRPARSRPSP
jgi:tripartite-type tricarboxylate transporter receptor subunit TctC